MPPTRPRIIPDEISDENDLKTWYEQELEKLGDEPAPGRELELLQGANRFYCNLKKQRNIRFDRNDPNPYKGPLVSALMESGWDIKRGSQKSKAMRPDAIRVFREALMLIQENPKACYRLGHLLKIQGKIGEAIGYFSRALEFASKQADFQEDLKLSSAQIANASGQSIALLQKLTGIFDHDFEFTFDPDQIATLQNLLIETNYRHVVYTIKVGRKIETKTIDSNDYDDLIVGLKSDPGAFVIDRYNQVSLIRYETKEKTYEQVNLISSRLNYLLGAFCLEAWETGTVRDNTITQNVHRLNDDLKCIGVDNWAKITYSHEYGERRLTATCDLSVHYFKSLLH